MKNLFKVSALVVLLGTGTSSSVTAQDMVGTGLALVNLISVASSFFAPESTGPDPTLEVVVQNRDRIEYLHERMGTIEKALLIAIKHIDGIHETLKNELKRGFEQEQRDKVRGIMKNIQSYVSAMKRDSNGMLVLTESNTDTLRRQWERLSNASGHLAQGHDINAPVLIGALGIEIGLLKALGEYRLVKVRKRDYRTRLVSLFDPMRSLRGSTRGPSLLEELVAMNEEWEQKVHEEREYVARNTTSNFKVQLDIISNMYRDGHVSCRDIPNVAREPRFELLMKRHSGGCFLPSDASEDLPSDNIHQMHHLLLEYVRNVILRLEPTEQERQWINQAWPYSPSWTEDRYAKCKDREREVNLTLSRLYRKWRQDMQDWGCRIW